MDLSQIGIIVFGLSAIWLVGGKEKKWRRWGFVLNLCSQPFWTYVAIMNEQYGILVLTLIYAWGWIRGTYNSWIKKEDENGIPKLSLR